MALMSRIEDCQKNLLTNCLQFCQKKIKGNCCSKYSKNNKFNKDCKLQQKFADFSRPFFVFSISLSGRMPRSLSYSCYFCDTCYSVFLDSKKNILLLKCNFCEICDLPKAPAGLFSVILAIRAMFACYTKSVWIERKILVLSRLCEICGLLETLLILFSFQLQNFVKCAILAIFVAKSFQMTRKILVITLRYFCDFFRNLRTQSRLCL